MAIEIKQRGVHLRVGNRCKLSAAGKSAFSSLASKDPTFTVRIIGDYSSGTESLGRVSIGLESDRRIESFHDLNGMTKEYYGYFFNFSDFLKGHFVVVPEEMLVAKSWIFKKKELKGHQCKFLGSVTDKFAYVEFKDNVGGGSADGLGKAGHCVVIPKDVLAEVKDKEANKKPKKKSKKKGR